jgi:hypothetical protein
MVKFFEPTPTFGTKHKRLAPSKQEESPYYWWWAYLKRNKDYLATCEKGGKGKYSKLYADFGDVRDDEFRLWWRAKGVELFAEQMSVYKFKEIDGKDEVPNQWSKDDFIFLQVPLTYDKKSLKKYFNQLLMDRHQRGRGRPTQKTRSTSAKYPLNGTYTIANLRLCLQVYERYLETRSGPSKLKLWELAVEMRLLPKDSMPDPKDDYADRLVKRNRLAATVGRYIKQAKSRIEKVALGKFPVA